MWWYQKYFFKKIYYLIYFWIKFILKNNYNHCLKKKKTFSPIKVSGEVVRDNHLESTVSSIPFVLAYGDMDDRYLRITS